MSNYWKYKKEYFKQHCVFDVIDSKKIEEKPNYDKYYWRLFPLPYDIVTS